MLCIHKWITVDSQYKWDYKRCSKCGKQKTVETKKDGYQPKKYPNWDR